MKKLLFNSLKDHIKKFRIESRIKAIDSFYEKIKRKYYSNPFEQMEDICGIRIICYYSSDLPIISRTIKNEFDIIKSVDKSDLLQTDEFGYRSKHFIVKIKDKKLLKSKKNLKDLKAEIQVRTILMDVHASIEHHLLIKKEFTSLDRFIIG